jgi:hypothetical protein
MKILLYHRYQHLILKIMPIKVWSGSPSFEYTHEGEALCVFLREMDHTYGADRETYHVLYNFLAGNQPIDLAVLKHKGLFVIEFKHVGGPVIGGENDPWSIRDGNRECCSEAASTLILSCR